MPQEARTRRARILILILLLGGIVLTTVGFTERFLGRCGLDELSQENREYLQSSFQRSLRIFALLSTVKAGLAVVEGTEIGVGFGLQVGDVVQAAYDYVDIAWRVVFAGGVLLLGTRYLLETAALLDQWLLLAALAASVLMVVTQGSPARFPRTHRSFREVAFFTTVLAAVLYLILPLSVAGGAYLSKQITAPSIEASTTGLSKLQEDLFPEDRNAEEDHGSTWGYVKQKLNLFSAYLKERASDLAVWMLKLIAAYLFDCLVFPLVLFVLLVLFTRLAGKSLFSIRGHPIGGEDPSPNIS